MEIIERLSYLLVALVFLALGSLAAFFYLQVRGGRKLQDAADKANSLLVEAREKKQQILLEATDEAMKARAVTDADYKERRDELRQAETRLTQKEEVLERKTEAAEQRYNDILAKEKDLEDLRTDINNLKDEQVEQLEKISGMNSDEAKETLLEAVEGEISQETSRRIRAWETKLKEEANDVAQQMLSSVIQRCASDVVSEIAASVIPLPSDDMKGRLIGREGRNIRALEQATGVDLIIDDTPETVTLSGFNGVRREIARIALTKLMQDGRIHPARIEEVVGRAKTEVEATMRIEGEQAGHKTGVHGLHPELIKLLGRLKFRTSYGQNVLMHSIEVAHLSGMIATELGTDHALARKAGLLHDVGKAVDHEVEGTHALIGADIVKQWDKSPEVAHAVGEHHGELPETSVIGYIVSAADAISASRPGARRESVELYLKRLEAVESVARGFTGVEQAYAIQAGREVRILVKPQEVDDMAALRLARDIVLKLEETLEYPGQIKVTVIRETRAVEYAK